MKKSLLSMILAVTMVLSMPAAAFATDNLVSTNTADGWRPATAMDLLGQALMEEKAGAKGITVLKPSPVLCTDNGAMIASAAYYAYKTGEEPTLELDAVPGLEF